VGLFPAFAAWGVLVVKNALMGAGKSLEELGPGVIMGTDYFLNGMVSLERGFIFTSMIWAAVSVFLIDRKFLNAAIWCGTGAILSLFGFIHTYRFIGNDVESVFGFHITNHFVWAYVIAAAVLVIFEGYFRRFHGLGK
jgi:AGZA family xanthine/uracil permease-like MFS transporter